MEQVLIDSDVIDFEVFTTEAQSSYRAPEFLVTFEVSLASSVDIDTVEKLSGVLSKIEYFKLDSIVVTDQYNYSEEG